MFEEIKDYLKEVNPEAIILDGFDSAVIGYSDNNIKVVFVYCYDKMVNVLTERDNMSSEDSIDYIEYNIIRLIPYMADNSPVIVRSV